jgi:hypothetical protein
MGRWSPGYRALCRENQAPLAFSDAAGDLRRKQSVRANKARPQQQKTIRSAFLRIIRQECG